MTAKKIVRLVLSLSLAILFVWLIARQINLDEFRKAFIGTTTLWVIAGIAAFSVGYSCRIERWHLMLQRDNSSLKWIHCFGPFFASFTANNVLPFRAGDALRVFAFNGRLGVSSGIVLATLFVERLLDLLMVLVLLDTLFEVNHFFVFFSCFNVSICSTVRSMERESNQGHAPSGCSLKSARSLDYFPPPCLT